MDIQTAGAFVGVHVSQAGEVLHMIGLCLVLQHAIVQLSYGCCEREHALLLLQGHPAC